MASFQAKTGWKRLKKRKNKNYRFVSLLHDAYDIIKKKQQKISKNKKTMLWLFFKPKQLEKAKKVRK